MHLQNLIEQSKALSKKEISSVELTQHYLKRIQKNDKLINSFITVLEEESINQAKEADKKISNGQKSPLLGIPLAHKDIFCMSGTRTTCGSKMLEKFIAPYDATVVSNLESAGMVTLGKTNMDEFAMGSSNETSYYKAVLNPWNKKMIPGGSSGGSAAAVAARLIPVATGTDTGGSIRQPAALCGITGIKPTYGRVSRYGMIAFASSLDQGGVLGASAADCALILEAMAGFDTKDSTSIDKEVPSYISSIDKSLKGLSIGLPKEYFTADLDNAIADQIENAIDVLKSLGCKFKDISLPNTHLAVPAYYVIAPAECSSNLARFDGVRFGHRCKNPDNINDLYMRSRAEGFGAEVKRRIMIGTYVLSAGYYDAYYLKAQKIRRLVSEDYKQAFQDVDLILGPTSPSTAFSLKEKVDDPVSMYLSDIYTIPVNLAGLPAISIPVGKANSMPVGMQLVSGYFQEEKLLNAAHQYQLQTNWHTLVPKGFE
ncbi:MAG: Asp-tRNA(Asn)/Glu-tRNA(Gln) amidotransferase subunit GatA [Pseudomonadota bacterium]